MTDETHYLELFILKGGNVETPIKLGTYMLEGSIDDEMFAGIMTEGMNIFRSQVSMEDLLNAFFRAVEVGGAPITYGPPTYDWQVIDGQEVQVEIPGKPNRADKWDVGIRYPEPYLNSATIVEIESMAEASLLAARSLANSIWMQQMSRPASRMAEAPEVTE